MRILGLDLGTNSIGWALVERGGGQTRLVRAGVHVFEKGVGTNKGVETSLAAERSQYRAARRMQRRRRWRKQATLRVLARNGFCPGLTEADIRTWRDAEQYPSHPEFLAWIRMAQPAEDGRPGNPYYCRWVAATRKLDLSQSESRYLLGRAFYHMVQRRGYRSNRITGPDAAGEGQAQKNAGETPAPARRDKDGDVQKRIDFLDQAMDGRTLGQYLYEECLGHERVRGAGHYTSRKHYRDEFDRICELQGLNADMRAELSTAIFMQRRLRSQRQNVGRCPLEPGKPRAAVSHPLFERFRALQMINSIRLAPPGATDLMPLSPDLRATALSHILRMRKPEEFLRLAKALLPRRAKIFHVGHEDGSPMESWRFNFRLDTSIAPSRTTSRLIELFGDQWFTELPTRYAKAGKKTPEQVMEDVWHAMYSFEDHDYLSTYGREQLGLTDEQAKRFAAPLEAGFASLSLAAIRRILPYLERGFGYSHAVFMAKLPDLLRGRSSDWAGEENELLPLLGHIIETNRDQTAIERVSNALMIELRRANMDPRILMATEATAGELRARVASKLAATYGKAWGRLPEEARSGVSNQALAKLMKQEDDRELAPVLTLGERIRSLLKARYALSDGELARLYHPSAIEVFPEVRPDQDGRMRMGSPRVSAIKNPVFMRTMHRLRHLLNALLAEGLIDRETQVRIEMARDLTTANERAAIQREQREREKSKRTWMQAIEELGYPATEIAIIKYGLWLEQGRMCLYTGREIEASAFLGDNPAYDIEHTIPRSRRLDNSLANLTLCDRQYNREVKGNRLPSELPDADLIAARAKTLWESTIEDLDARVEKLRGKARSSDKDASDKARQDMHYTLGKLRHLRAKLGNFERAEVPEGFTGSQLVDTRIIGKYALHYLKSCFVEVYSVKATTVHAVKEIWGLQEKNRGSHAHHAIDAIVTACLTPGFYKELAEYYHAYERYLWAQARRPIRPMPWPDFDRQLNEELPASLLVARNTKNILLKQTYRRVRKQGGLDRDAQGRIRYARGQTVRGSLHKDTIYGKIKAPPGSAGGCDAGEMWVVHRVPLGKDFKDFDSIVDPVVQKRVLAQREAMIEGLPVWFDEAGGSQIRRVRIREVKIAANLISLGAHRDVSKHEHKRERFAMNDGNYMTAVYRGTVNERPKTKVKIISNFQAAVAAREQSWKELLPEEDSEGLKLVYRLLTGTRVIFFREHIGELRTLSTQEISRRLYHVRGMEGRVTLEHHLCAESAQEIGRGNSRMNLESLIPEPVVRLTTGKMRVAVEGKDFRIDVLGTIQWLGDAGA